MLKPIPKVPAADRKVPRTPFNWLAEVAHLPGKTLHLGLALSWLATFARRPGVSLTRATLRRFSISRDAAYDGLRRLERAALVRVWRLPGRSPHVTLIDADGQPLSMLA